jgi:outer membrane protein OmpA-like peptidoglycan-associated protein
MSKRVFAAAALAFLCALPCAGQDDAEGAKDHPMFPRMPGYYIDDYDATDFGGVDLYLEPEKQVEGRFWRITYRVREGEKRFGPFQIARNYTDLAVKRRGKRLTEQLDASGGTSVAQLPVAGRNIWIQLSIADRGEYYELTIVEEASMEQKVAFTAAELARLLNENGSVALHNILFDTGKATLKAESAAALAPIGEMLKVQPAFRREIQGHSDNVGVAAQNLKLSPERAAAVKGYLVQTCGGAADRLTTSGFGDGRPVADNRTDQGRALNRRVELVKQ